MLLLAPQFHLIILLILILQAKTKYYYYQQRSFLLYLLPFKSIHNFFQNFFIFNKVSQTKNTNPQFPGDYYQKSLF